MGSQIMLSIKTYHRLAGVIGLQSCKVYPGMLLNCTASNFRCAEVRTLSVMHNKCKHKVDFSAQKTTNSLLRTKDMLIFIKLANLQQKRYSSLVAKLVNNASSKVQPYIKLMRLDKPIGKRPNYSVNYLFQMSFYF